MNEEAVRKLKDEINSNRASLMAAPVLNHMIERLGEDDGLAEDVLKKSKNWKACEKYLISKAKEFSGGHSSGIAVEDAKVYERAEDYFRGEDKPEKESQKPAEAEKKEQTKNSKENTPEAVTEAQVKPEGQPERPKAQSKPKKKAEDDIHQLSIFDLIGAENE